MPSVVPTLSKQRVEAFDVSAILSIQRPAKAESEKRTLLVVVE
jgi:hypothetical protein